jgi:hypothetical protein
MPTSVIVSLGKRYQGPSCRCCLTRWRPLVTADDRHEQHADSTRPRFGNVLICLICGRRLATHGGSCGVQSYALEALDGDGLGDDLDHDSLNRTT